MRPLCGLFLLPFLLIGGANAAASHYAAGPFVGVSEAPAGPDVVVPQDSTLAYVPPRRTVGVKRLLLGLVVMAIALAYMRYVTYPSLENNQKKKVNNVEDAVNNMENDLRKVFKLRPKPEHKQPEPSARDKFLQLGKR